MKRESKFKKKDRDSYNKKSNGQKKKKTLGKKTITGLIEGTQDLRSDLMNWKTKDRQALREGVQV